MKINESKILLSLYEQGGFKPRFGEDGERIDGGTEHNCTRKITLGPSFIANALKEVEPAYKLRVLKSGDSPRKYHQLTTNMKLHLHVKQFVADTMGIDFGGGLDCFDWTLV